MHLRHHTFVGVLVAVLGALVAGLAALPEARGYLTAPTAGPVVYAHRGGAEEAPENTLGAFRRSVATYGVGVWLELDVQLSADGQLVVIHDHTLDRTTDCAGAVDAHTAAALAACDAATAWNEAHPGEPWDFEPVPTLHSVLVDPALSQARFMIELKNIPGEGNFDPTGAAGASALVELLAAVDVDPMRILVQSFFPTSLDQVEVRAPHLRTALLTTSQLPGAPAGVGFHLHHNAAFSTVRGYEVSAPDQYAVDLTPDVVATAQALGRQVVVWTVDDPVRAVELAAMGVDGIITNTPGAVVAALGTFAAP